MQNTDTGSCRGARVDLISFSLFLRLLNELVLHDVALFESHAVVNGIELVLDLVELVHEHVGLPLLVLFLLLLGAHPVFKPLHLFLVVLDLDLLLEE